MIKTVVQVTGHLAPKSFRLGYLAPYSRTRNITNSSVLDFVYGLKNEEYYVYKITEIVRAF